MKILFVADQYEHGGATEALIEMIHLLKTDFNIDSLVITGHEDEVGSRLEKECIQHLFCGFRQFAIHKPQKGIRRLYLTLLKPYFMLKYYLANKSAIKRAEKAIDFDEIDLIYSNTNRVDVGAYLAKRHNKRHIWHLRECPKGHFNLIYNRFRPFKYMNQSADCFVAISDFVKREWVKIGLDENKIRVFYDGVNLEQIVPRDAKEIGNELKLVCVGEINEKKGQYIIIKALRELSSFRIPILLDFWGEGKETYVEQLKQLTGLGDSIKISFRGFSNDIKNVLNKYDIGINPSVNEGFGRTTVEYMAAGLCVLALNSGANSELIRDGENGFLFENPNDLSKRISALVDDQTTLTKVADQGRQWALMKMDMRSNLKDFVELFISYKGDL